MLGPLEATKILEHFFLVLAPNQWWLSNKHLLGHRNTCQYKPGFLTYAEYTKHIIHQAGDNDSPMPPLGGLGNYSREIFREIFGEILEKYLFLSFSLLFSTQQLSNDQNF